MFISKRYVSIKTPLLHLQEVCVNWITTFSSPRGMFPLGIETIWGHPLFIPFQPVFLFEFNLSNLLCLGSFLLFEESKCIISPFPPKLPSSIFSITTTSLQLLNIYFTMVKRKFTAMVTPNTYDWIHLNLKHTRHNMWNDKNAFEISKRSHLTRPPQAVVKNQNTGIRMEKTNWQNKWMANMALGECKDTQRKFCIIQTNCKHSKGEYGRLPWAMFAHAMDFFQE